MSQPVPQQVNALPRIHEFASSGGAYDVSQCYEGISDGDVLLVPAEKVAAVLVRAWPGAVTAEYGELHRIAGSAATFEGGAYSVSIHVAETCARALGWPLREDPDQVERRRTLRTHSFDSSEDVGAALERGEISEGDVVVVESEEVATFIDGGRVALVTQGPGQYESFAFPPQRWRGGAWSASLDAARQAARDRGYLLAPEVEAADEAAEG